MSNALALAPSTPAPVVTRDQLALIKKTVAVGATDAELELYLYDCSRRGVHPLDRLVHFTKRSGRYTPITSIDFLRTRAAETGEMAGSDDAQFENTSVNQPREAHITVYRLTNGQRFGYSATARWAEYCPPSGQDHMWKKFPYLMLSKCAESLALRKAFPQQLGGLYVHEELEQARPDFATEATAIADQYAAPASQPSHVSPPPAIEMPPDLDNDARDQIEIHEFTSERLAALKTGVVLITQFHQQPTKNPNVTRYTITVAGGPDWPTNQTRLTTINEKLASWAEAAWHAEQAVAVTTTKGKFGHELATIEDAHEIPF